MQQSNYIESHRIWHPNSTKGIGIFYKFDVKEDVCIDILPDACIDIMIKSDENNVKALICGGLTETDRLELHKGEEYFGFRPYSILGLKLKECMASELINSKFTLGDIVHSKNLNNFTEKLVLANTFDSKCSIFLDFLKEKIIDYNYYKSFPEYCALAICNSEGNISIDELAALTGYTTRYCNKKFKQAYGISPKHYSEILRLQNVIKYFSELEVNTEKIINIAYDCGFYDQSHFSKNIKSMTHRTPLKLYHLMSDNNPKLLFT